MTTKFRRNILCNGLILALAAGGALSSAHAQDAGEKKQFNVPAQPAASALNNFAAQANITLVFSQDVVAGVSVQALEGNYSTKEGIERLLEGTGLSYQQVSEDTIAISKPTEGLGTDAAVNESESSGSSATTMDTMVVTGTRIRGGSTASPTIIIGEQEFKEEGFTDLGEVIRSVSQNYNGGQNPGVAAGASLGAAGNYNRSGGSALNLRGLGPDATLTLLNGRRLAYDGFVQAVDISAIPIDAVERVEIVSDGASAIYGSDAVGGVINVILKSDFDGVTLGSLYGTSADGGLTRQDYTATAGATWDSGGLIAIFKKSDQDPIYADQRSYTESMYDPTTIYPGSALRSALISAHQWLGDNAELRIDALRTVRTQTTYVGRSSYYYAGEPENTVTLIAPSLLLSLPHDWSLTIGVTRGEDEGLDKGNYVYADGTSSSSGYCYCNTSQSWDVSAEGALAYFGERDVRLAVGVGGRKDEFLMENLVSGNREGGAEQSRYLYAELSLPVVGVDNARPGLRRLEFTIAGRAEDYDSYGTVATPKLGVIYDPNKDFTLKASWGRSFKAPTLYQRYSGQYTYLLSTQDVGCTSCAADETVLISGGGNQDLKPERARTWTASLAFHPEAVPGLEVELTYFDIDYTDRIVAPISSFSQALSNPAYAEFVTYSPTESQIETLLSDYDDDFYNYSGADYDASKVVAIVASQYTNVAKQRVNGVDLSSSYGFPMGSGKLEIRGSASWLSLHQQNSSGQAETELSGQIFYPAKFKSRLGTVWSRGGLSVSAFANYTSGVTSTLTDTTEKGASFTTFDTTLSYNTSPGKTALSDMTFSLSVDNIFNREPPLYTTPSVYYATYDSTNYSAIGRYVTVSVSKHW